MAVINPMGWRISSLGLVRRSLKIALVFTPLMVLGCLMGVPYGLTGVAFAYSAVMVLWVVPHVAWCVHGTAISLRDVAATVLRPLASGIVAGAVGYAAHLLCGELLSPLLRLVVESGVLVVTFFAVLVFVAGQKALYVDLLRGLSRGRAAQGDAESDRAGIDPDPAESESEKHERALTAASVARAAPAA
jgi:PST family polysaccharide transporter